MDVDLIDLDKKQIRRKAAAYLSAAIERTHLHRPASQAITMCPTLEPIMLRLAYAVTDLPRVRYSGRHLVDVALEAGLESFFATPDPSKNGVQAFLLGCLGRMGDLISTAVASKDSQWTLDGGIPLGRWVERKGRRGLDFFETKSPMTPGQARSVMLGWLCSEEDLNRIRAISPLEGEEVADGP